MKTDCLCSGHMNAKNTTPDAQLLINPQKPQCSKPKCQVVHGNQRGLEFQIQIFENVKSITSSNSRLCFPNSKRLGPRKDISILTHNTRPYTIHKHKWPRK